MACTAARPGTTRAACARRSSASSPRKGGLCYRRRAAAQPKDMWGVNKAGLSVRGRSLRVLAEERGEGEGEDKEPQRDRWGNIAPKGAPEADEGEEGFLEKVADALTPKEAFDNLDIFYMSLSFFTLIWFSMELYRLYAQIFKASGALTLREAAAEAIRMM